MFSVREPLPGYAPPLPLEGACGSAASPLSNAPRKIVSGCEQIQAGRVTDCTARTCPHAARSRMEKTGRNRVMWPRYGSLGQGIVNPFTPARGFGAYAALGIIAALSGIAARTQARR